MSKAQQLTTWVISLITVGGIAVFTSVTYQHSTFATTKSVDGLSINLNQRINDKDKATDDKFKIILDTMNRIENKLDERLK